MPIPAAIGAATGARLISWQHVVAGHTHAQKWLVELHDGRKAFVKAGTETSARAQIEREGILLESVDAAYMPDVYGTATVDGWSVLVLEDLSGAVWPPPFPDRGGALLDTVMQVAATPAPHGLRRRPQDRPLGTYWQRIAADPDPLLGLGLFTARWLGSALPVLDAAESAAQLAGDDFIHDDVWAENVCYADRGVLLIDWASASVGDRRIDLANALLSIRASGTRPPSIGFPEEAGYAALLAGAYAYQAAQPTDDSIPRASVLRAHWLQSLEFALDWASELLGLEPRVRP